MVGLEAEGQAAHLVDTLQREWLDCDAYQHVSAVVQGVGGVEGHCVPQLQHQKQRGGTKRESACWTEDLLPGYIIFYSAAVVVAAAAVVRPIIKQNYCQSVSSSKDKS